MVYAEHVESSYRHENSLLRQEVRKIHLDLEDAVESRRDLQARLREAEARLDYVQQENDTLKVNIAVLLWWVNWSLVADAHVCS